VSATTDVPRLLLLARHGACDSRGFLGSTDIALSPKGRDQAASLARLIAARKPARCFCSPLQRCRETAALALAGTPLKPEIDDDLREIGFGRWEGMSFEDIARAEPEAVERFAHLDHDFAFPDGEMFGAFLQRVARAVARMTACAEQPVLAFTHGGVIGAAICQLLALHPRQYVLFSIKHASLATLQVFGDRGVLAGLNEAGEAGGA
jgi:alpha-ribazole phosphatase